MAQAQRTQAGAGASYRARGALVIAQVSLTLVLLVGAGLLARSFLRLAQVDPGYRTERALVLDISASVPDGPAGQRDRVRLYDEITARLAALPGVSAVGGVNTFPLTGGNHANGTFIIMGRPDEQLDHGAAARPHERPDPEWRCGVPRGGAGILPGDEHPGDPRPRLRGPRRAGRTARRRDQRIVGEGEVA